MADALGTPGGVVSDEDHRLALAGLISPATSTLAVRTGVLVSPTSNALITGTSATGTMTVNVLAHHWVTTRATGDGIYIGTKEASGTVNIVAAPGSNSRIDVVYSKQNDTGSSVSADTGTTQELYGVVTGTAAAVPTKPALPIGATEIGTVTVAAGATNTLGAGVTIATTANQVVARGCPVPVRTQAERDALTAYNGLSVKRLDLGGAEQQYISGAWKDLAFGTGVLATLATSAPASYAAAFTANGTTPIKTYKDQNGMVTLDGLITASVLVSNIVGPWFTIAAGHRPSTLRIGMCYVEGTGIAAYQIDTAGVVTGIGWVVGGTSIPAGRYVSFAHPYKAA